MGSVAERALGHGEAGHSRIVLLTDAVVAIAMTLLVLPLVEVADEFDTTRPGAWWQQNASLAISFVVSFVVIFAFWSALGGAQARLEDVAGELPGIRLLTMGWLLVIVFLPFPTAVVGHHLDPTSVPFYIGTMTAASVLTSAIMTLSARVDAAAGPRWWPWTTTLVFALCALLGFVNAEFALYALLVLIPLRTFERRILRRSGRTVEGQEATDD